MLAINVHADKPVCYEDHGGYCNYNGKVERIYINKQNLILLYFETPMTQSDIETTGSSATVLFAGAISLNTDPDFGKLFYSTALAAQASGRNVQIQLRNNIGAYMEIDRIWLYE